MKLSVAAIAVMCGAASCAVDSTETDAIAQSTGPLADDSFIGPCFMVGCDDGNDCTDDTCTLTGCRHDDASGQCFFAGGDGQCYHGQCCKGFLYGNAPDALECQICVDDDSGTYDSGYDGCVHIPLDTCREAPRFCATADDCYFNGCTASLCVSGHCKHTPRSQETLCFGVYPEALSYIGYCNGDCFCRPYYE